MTDTPAKPPDPDDLRAKVYMLQRYLENASHTLAYAAQLAAGLDVWATDFKVSLARDTTVSDQPQLALPADWRGQLGEALRVRGSIAPSAHANAVRLIETWFKLAPQTWTAGDPEPPAGVDVLVDTGESPDGPHYLIRQPAFPDAPRTLWVWAEGLTAAHDHGDANNWDIQIRFAAGRLVEHVPGVTL